MVTSNNSDARIKVSFDTMGGDYAPLEIIKGALQSIKEYGIEAILVGPTDKIERVLSSLDIGKQSIEIVEADELIVEGEAPALAVLRKPNSSIAVATRLVKEGKADTVISAGSTGACMVSALQYLGTLPGIERPVAGGAFFRLSPQTVILDLGANVGCQPYQLVEFAIIGNIYAKVFLGLPSPTIALLNVGAEEGKGNELAKEGYALLKNSGLNFIGNVEGMDIPAGKANVIVCDGFVGNVLAKFCEGVGQALNGWIKDELRNTLSSDELETIATKLYGILSPGMAMGGGPLLGVNGHFGVTHGRSRAQQITGTVKQMKLAIESNFIQSLRDELEKFQKSIQINKS